MAKLVWTGRPNSLKIKMFGIMGLGTLLVLFVFGMVVLAFKVNPFLWIGCFLLLLLLPLKKRYFILKAGADGEGQVRRLFQKLPEGYFVLSDLILQAQGHKSQIDHLVLCEKAAFVVEVKNISGRLLGNAQDKTLRQLKRTEEKRLYNPLKQAQGHAETVRLFLLEHGISLPVWPLVYFCNAKLYCDVNFDEKQVFCQNKNGEEKMLLFLRSVPGKPLATMTELKKLVRAIKKAQ